jgi:hypothetical protein
MRIAKVLGLIQLNNPNPISAAVWISTGIWTPELWTKTERSRLI